VPTIDDTDRSPSIMEGRHALLPKFCAHGNDGPGIFEIVRGRIFGPFLATKGDGKSTSICLAVCPHIAVERHGGGIRFTSEPGATRFQLRPPMDGSVGEASRSVVCSLEVGQ
jgi:nitrogen-specific signal transduction histidine kinase